MPSAALESGVELEYNTFGDPGNPTLLLVNGYTSQMIVWEQELLGGLVAQGLHVVIYDNRDVGLSTKFDGQLVDPMEVLQSLMAGEQVDVPYTLSDMAADGMDLLSYLGIDRAHIAGVSMGGMIVQMMAIEHPARIISMTSIMSSPGDPKGRSAVGGSARCTPGAASHRARGLHRRSHSRSGLVVEEVLLRGSNQESVGTAIRSRLLSRRIHPAARRDLCDGRPERSAAGA